MFVCYSDRMQHRSLLQFLSPLFWHFLIPMIYDGGSKKVWIGFTASTFIYHRPININKGHV